MNISRICILGGTGFVGRHLIQKLAAQGFKTVVLSRNPQRHRDLAVNPGCSVVAADISKKEELVKHFSQCDAVVNLIGILNERKKHDFRRVHIELVDKISSACRQAGVKRLLHMSALHADAASGTSIYLRSKGEGENRAHTNSKPDVAVTSFRPSVIFGHDDSFINRFADLLKLPGPMPLACPKSRFAPIFVDDVCQAMVNTLQDRRTFGQRYDLCGPETYTLLELVKYIADKLEKRKFILPLPDSMSRLQATILGALPGKLFTMDNYLSLQTDSVCPESTAQLENLGITPTHLDSVAPVFLKKTREKNRYMDLRTVSGK